MDFSVCLNSYQRGHLPSSLFFLTHLLLLLQPRAMRSGNMSNLHPRKPGPQWAHQLLPTLSAGYSRTEILQPFPRLSQGLKNKPSIPVVKESLTLSTIQLLSAPPLSFQGPPTPTTPQLTTMAEGMVGGCQESLIGLYLSWTSWKVFLTLLLWYKP